MEIRRSFSSAVKRLCDGKALTFRIAELSNGIVLFQPYMCYCFALKGDYEALKKHGLNSGIGSEAVSAGNCSDPSKSLAYWKNKTLYPATFSDFLDPTKQINGWAQKEYAERNRGKGEPLDLSSLCLPKPLEFKFDGKELDRKGLLQGRLF